MILEVESLQLVMLC